MSGVDFGRIAITARLAAHYRQFADLPYARDAARLVRADEAFAELVAAHGLDPDQLRFYAAMFEARYRSVDAAIRASGARQVLELAAGYTLRGLVLARDGFRSVETDLPEVAAARSALLDGPPPARPRARAVVGARARPPSEPGGGPAPTAPAVDPDRAVSS
jgi:O-methyltransferase involved in polyketide biosynthesis